MARIICTADSWPILRWYYPPKYSAEEWTAHLEECRELIARRGEPFAGIAYLDKSQPPNARQRKEAAEFWQNLRKEKLDLVAVAYVVTEPILRGALTAVFWVQPPPCPYRICGSGAAAADWANSTLRAARGER